MPRLSELTANPDEIQVAEETQPTTGRLSDLTGGDEKQVTFIDDKGISVEHSGLASDRYIKESVRNSVYSKDFYPSVPEEHRPSFIKSLGLNLYAGVMDSATSVNKLLGFGAFKGTRDLFITPGEEEIKKIRELTVQDNPIGKFAQDFSYSLGNMGATLPLDIMSGGATKIALVGKVLPNIAKYITKIPNFAIGMGIRGFAQKVEEGKTLEAPLTAAENTAIGTLYGVVGVGWKSFPKMGALGLAEAHYNALKQNRLATPEESIEGTANGLAFATVFHTIGVIEKGINNVQEKSILKNSYRNINGALESGDIDTIKNEYDKLIKNEKVSPQTKDAIINAFNETKDAHIQSESKDQPINLTKEESKLLESAIAKSAPGDGRAKIIRDIIEGQLGSTVLTNTEAIENTDVDNILSKEERAKLLKVLESVKTSEDEYSQAAMQEYNPEQLTEFKRQKGIIANKAIEAVLGKKFAELAAPSREALTPEEAAVMEKVRGFGQPSKEEVQNKQTLPPDFDAVKGKFATEEDKINFMAQKIKDYKQLSDQQLLGMALRWKNIENLNEKEALDMEAWNREMNRRETKSEVPKIGESELLQLIEKIKPNLEGVLTDEQFNNLNDRIREILAQSKAFGREVDERYKEAALRANKFEDQRIQGPGETESRPIISTESIMPDKTGNTPLRRKIAQMEERRARVEISEDALSEIDTIRQNFKRRITRYKDAYLKEELQGIPSFYVIKEGGIKPDEAMGELRDRFGVDVQNEVELKDYLQNLEKVRKDLLADIKVNRPQLVTKRESTLLNDRIKATEQGIKEGRIKTKDEITEIQTEIINAIEQADLPLDERGKFLRAIKNVQTAADLKREFPDIAKRLQEMKNKQIQTELIDQIQKVAERAKSSNVLAVEYADLIDSAVNEFELKGHREDTIKSLQDTRKYIEQAIKEGKDVEMPEEELKKLEILGRKPLKEITVTELEDLLDTVENLERSGKAKLHLRQMADERRKQQALLEIERDSKPLLEKNKLKAPVGEKLNIVDNLKNKYIDAQNFAMKKDLAITPMDVIFDTLDGNKQYKGANLRIFKQTLNREFSKYLETKDVAEKEVKELAKKLKLNEQNFERIGVYAANMQDGGYDKLINSGYSDKEIGLELTPNETQLYSLMRDKLESFKPAISEIMRLVYNEPFYAVKNYFPFMTDFEKMSDAEMRSRFGDNVEQYGLAPRKNVSRGFTRKRVGGNQKLAINAMQVFLRHVDNASYFTTVGKETKFLGELAAREEYANSVGELGQELVRDWIDLAARKGKIAGEGNNILDTLRKTSGASILAFRLSSALIQPTSIGNGAALIGNYAFDGAYKIASDKQWRYFVRDNMPEVKFRIGDDPAFLEFGNKSVVEKAEQAGFWALEHLDQIAAASIAAGAYEKYCKENSIEVDFTKPNQGAIDYAQLMMRRSQSSSFFMDAPSALTRGKFTGNKSVDKTIFQFQSFMLNDWSMIRHDLWRAGIMEKRIGQASNIFFFLSLTFTAQMGIRAGTKALVNQLFNREPKPDDESLLHKVIDNVFLQQIPFVGSFAQSLDYGSNPIPVLEFLNKSMKAFSSVSKSKEADKKMMALLRGIVMWLPGGSNLVPFLKVNKETDELGD